MSQAIPPEQDPQFADPSASGAEPAAAKRRGPPWWGVVLFLGLLGGMVLINQWVTTGGPPIEWFSGTLDEGLAKISAEKPRLFLYLYEAGDQTHQRNELQVFPQRWARSPLASAICVRIQLGNDMPSHTLRKRFAYNGQPLFLLLDRTGAPVGRAEGSVDERQFSTYIGKPILQALKKPIEGE